MEHEVISIRAYTMFGDKMNLCVEEHVPKYKITYKPSNSGEHKPGNNRLYIPVWLVCESCMEKKKCFGSEDEIVFIETLE